MGRVKIAIDREQLKSLYLGENLTPLKIGQRLGCSFKTVRNRLKEFGIPFKNPSFARMRYPKTDYSGSLADKAYMIGFRIGDLNVYMRSPASETIVVRCHTTQKEQVAVMRDLFEKYGKVSISHRGEHLTVNCFLNKSFGFLLLKDRSAWRWITKESKDVMLSFVAGYTDAEGNFIINQGRARFKIDSYDLSILHWMSKWLTQQGIPNKFRCIYRKGDPWNGAYPLNKDLWRLNVNDKMALKTFIDYILPFSRHAGRIRGVKLAKRNIYEREQHKK